MKLNNPIKIAGISLVAVVIAIAIMGNMWRDEYIKSVEGCGTFKDSPVLYQQCVDEVKICEDIAVTKGVQEGDRCFIGWASINSNVLPWSFRWLIIAGIIGLVWIGIPLASKVKGKKEMEWIEIDDPTNPNVMAGIREGIESLNPRYYTRCHIGTDIINKGRAGIAIARDNDDLTREEFCVFNPEKNADLRIITTMKPLERMARLTDKNSYERFAKTFIPLEHPPSKEDISNAVKKEGLDNLNQDEGARQ